MNKYLKRKDGILIDAIKLMDEKGLHGLTTRELAIMQGITEPAIYRQFKNKNDIIRALLEDFGKYDEAISATVIQATGDPTEALFSFGKLYSEYYENYPEIASIMLSIEYIKTDKNLFALFKSILDGRKRTLEVLLEKVDFGTEITRNDLAELINGVLVSQTMFWKMEGCTYSLSERIEKNMKFLMASRGENK